MNHIKPSHKTACSFVSKNSIIKGMVLFFLFIMLLYPACAFRGAASGLLLWFHNVLPALLPFIIISNLVVRLNITKQISRLFYPLLGKLLHISKEGCYPVVIGFLSGLPMGAKTTADMLAAQRLSLPEGQFLLSLCNNASPMFILGYISVTQLQVPHLKYILLLIIYGSSILGALLFRLLYYRQYRIVYNNQTHCQITHEKDNEYRRFSFELLDASIMNGFEIVTKIGGYIILFSILAQIMKEAIPVQEVMKSSMMGILEITTGISQTCSTGLDIKSKIVLVCTLATFGGLSGIAQTKSVIQNARLSISLYFLVKLLSAFLALIFTLLYVHLIYR